MPQGPGSIFGGLLSVCVSDNYVKDKKLLAEGVLFLALGAVSSVVTTYILSSAGLLL
ncbi:MAG TPA: hypothetical protein VJR06_00165 [Nitrososphaerales archaeon]|nr:hypothetical protein [Nitrososphaerales archaeon]